MGAKGLIHVGSNVEFHKSLIADKEYKVLMKLKNLNEKF